MSTKSKKCSNNNTSNNNNNDDDDNSFKNINRKYHFVCKEYPMYEFESSSRYFGFADTNNNSLRVTIARSIMDSTLMVDLLIGEILTLIPVSKKQILLLASYNDEEDGSPFSTSFFSRIPNTSNLKTKKSADHHILCKIMTIDHSPNGRRSFITVQRLL